MKKVTTKKVKNTSKKKKTSSQASFLRTSEPKTTKKAARKTTNKATGTAKKGSVRKTSTTKKTVSKKPSVRRNSIGKLKYDADYIRSLKLQPELNKNGVDLDDLNELEPAEKVVFKKKKKKREKKVKERKPRKSFIKNAFVKNTLRLISSTKSRFISLLLITFIGSSFFMGLSSVSPVMEHTLDTFDDQHELQDIQIYSNYGFTQENFDAIKQIDGVATVEGSKWFDCYSIFEDGSRKTVRVQELDNEIASITLKSGRMPENEYECLALYSKHDDNNIALGSVLYLIKDDDSELDDVISNRVFTVVGLAETPEYLCYAAETSTFHNKSLDDIIFVDSDLFLSEYYTSAYVTIDGAADYNTFSDDYDSFMDYYIYRLNILAETEKDYNRSVIIEKAQAELDAAQAELDAEKASGQAQLNAAKAQLDAAYAKLITGSATIDATENVIDTLTDKFNEQQDKVKSQENSVNSAINSIESAYGKSFEEVLNNISALYAVYSGLDYNKIDPYIEAYKAAVQADLDGYNATLNDNLAKQEDIENQIKAIIDEISITIDTDIEKGDGEESEESEPTISIDVDIEGLTEQKEALIEELTELKKDELMLDIKVEIAQKEIEVIDNKDEQAIKNLIEALKLDIQDLSGVESIPDTYSALIKLKTAQIQLDTSNQLLTEIKKQIEDNTDSLDEGREEVETGTVQYKTALAKYNASEATYNSSIADAQAQLDKAEQDLNNLSEGKWTILDRNSHVSTVLFGNSADQMKTIGTAIPVMFFLVAILVCMTTMARLIDEQRGQIGCLLALGFTKSKIIWSYVFYAFVASFVGSFIGVFAGVYTLPSMIYSIWQLSYRLPDMVLYIPVKNALISVLSFVVLMCLVTFFVLKSNLKDNPSSLLRPKPPKKVKKTMIEKVGFIWSRLGLTSKITARNIFRYKQRFFMTLIGIAGCVALLILGLGVQDSIDIVPTNYGSIFHYNGYLEISDQEYSDNFVNYLSGLGEDVNPVSTLSYNSKITIEGKDDEDIYGRVYVMDKDDCPDFVYIRNYDTKEEFALDDSGVIISCKFAKDNGFKVGDSMFLESNDGVVGEVKVAGIFECYIYDNILMSDKCYENAFGVSPNRNKIYFNYDGDFTALYDTLSWMNGYVSLTSNEKVMKSFNNMIQSLYLVVVIVVVFAGMLAFVVLINLTEVNISERKREIATLKVLGFSKIEVRNYIFKELIILTVAGSIIGIPLGYVAHSYLISIINYNKVFIPTVINLSTVFKSLIITYLFLTLILLIERRSVRNVKMVESLKSVE